MPSASVRLRRKLDVILPAYDTPGQMLEEHPRARELYSTYLAASSYVTLAMVPLMEAALDRSRVLASTDPVAAGLAGYLQWHIPEEMHGDEPGDDLLEDLAAVGVDTDALRLRPLPEKIAALIGTQFFRVRHAHPVAILGLLWLEVYPPDALAVERLIERTGLPREGFRQLLLHSELDARHGVELQEVVDSLPLEPWHEQLIGLSALQTMSFLIDAWLEVVAAPALEPAT
ncbi:MAG TPA: iron-containing redox enzyme family protein [Solirubrobacteraceae bacterium]